MSSCSKMDKDGSNSQTLRQDVPSSGSDMSYDFYCEVCHDDGINVEAGGFCVQCGEYLCEDCCKSHKRTRLTKSHTLQIRSEMPNWTLLSAARERKVVKTTCKHHPNELVKFFCKDHGEVGCLECLIARHKKCTATDSILDNSSGILDSREYSNLMGTINQLNDELQNIIPKTRYNIAKAKDSHTEVLRSVKQLREQFIARWDRLEADIIKEANTLMAEQEKKMESISDECSAWVEKLQSIKLHFDNLESSRLVCEAYISMKTYANELKMLEGRVSSAKKETVTKTFRFEPNYHVQSLVIPKLGNISIEIQSNLINPDTFVPVKISG